MLEGPQMGIKIEPNDNLRGDLEHQLRIAPELENFVKTTMVGPQESTIDRRKACIFMALASKSFTTFQAIVRLLQSGLFLEDVAVLVRVLYESTMTATFLLYSDDRAVDDYADFFMYRNWRDHQLVEALDPVVAKKALRPEDLQEMESQYNQWLDATQKASGHHYQRKRWQNLPNGFKVFTILYAAIYRQCSAYAHSDVRSIQGHIQENAEGVVSISKPISKEHCGKLMHAANFLMLTICFVVTGTFYGTKHIPQSNSLVLKWNGTQLST
jgi:hypothetical protein